MVDISPFSENMIGPRVSRLDTSDFNRYLRSLSASLGPGVRFSTIIKAEAAAILAKAADKTKRAKASKINKRYTILGSTKTSRKKGPRTQNPELIPYVRLRGKKFPTSGMYYPNATYQEIKKKLLFFKDRAKSRMYSGKATWLLIAKKGRLNTRRFPARSKMDQAVAAQAGIYSQNSVENGTQRKIPFKFSFKIFNGARCALNRSAGGIKALKSAMGGRMGYYRRNMRTGAFNTASDVARAYPGVYVD